MKEVDVLLCPATRHIVCRSENPINQLWRSRDISVTNHPLSALTLGDRKGVWPLKYPALGIPGSPLEVFGRPGLKWSDPWKNRLLRRQRWKFVVVFHQRVCCVDSSAHPARRNELHHDRPMRTTTAYCQHRRSAARRVPLSRRTVTVHQGRRRSSTRAAACLRTSPLRVTATSATRRTVTASPVVHRVWSEAVAAVSQRTVIRLDAVHLRLRQQLLKQVSRRSVVLL